ncbi:MAG: type II toxin-antitoxin system VapC family toxin, partial [Actinomycetota bacterium]|nr:type II toxin-antitoxin system VapC family toxin [Actinomycetota bacterium]
GHKDVVTMFGDPELGLITGTWTRIEVTGALVRAARAGRRDEEGILSLLDADLGVEGPITVIAADQADVEVQALQLVREHAIRAMDAWHLATAKLVLPSLIEPGEETGFATWDQAQAAVAEVIGLRILRGGLGRWPPEIVLRA